MDISLAQPIVTEEMRDEADRVLREEFFVGGDSVEAFESEFADYVGTNYAVAVDSGTRAIQLALEAAGIGEDDTVLTTPATFVATANAIHHAGADVRLVDVNLDTYTIDVETAKSVLAEESIDAVIPVHLYGYPVDVPALREAAPDIPIIADACQAHGAAHGDTLVGALSTLSCFSFYPSKNMTVAGDGGIVTVDDTETAERLRSLRDVGREEGQSRYEHPRIGYTARLNTVNAAIGREQLRHLDDWNERRKEIAARYADGLAGIGDLNLPPTGDAEYTPAWYLYVVRTDYREALASYMEKQGVETGIHYGTPVHLQPPYRERGYVPGDFPASETWAETVLSLPMHPELSDEEIDYVVDTIAAFFDEIR